MSVEEKLFVYGTLRDPKVQKKVFGRTTRGTSDALEGYKKSTILLGDREYPIIVPDRHSSIEGLVISVTPEELKMIDKYETSAYQRERIVLKSGKTAWVYRKPLKE